MFGHSWLLHVFIPIPCWWSSATCGAWHQLRYGCECFNRCLRSQTPNPRALFLVTPYCCKSDCVRYERLLIIISRRWVVRHNLISAHRVMLNSPVGENAATSSASAFYTFDTCFSPTSLWSFSLCAKTTVFCLCGPKLSPLTLWRAFFPFDLCATTPCHPTRNEEFQRTAPSQQRKKIRKFAGTAIAQEHTPLQTHEDSSAPLESLERSPSHGARHGNTERQRIYLSRSSRRWHDFKIVQFAERHRSRLDGKKKSAHTATQ